MGYKNDLSEILNERRLKLVDECPKLKMVVLSRDHSVQGTTTEAAVCRVREHHRERKRVYCMFRAGLSSSERFSGLDVPVLPASVNIATSQPFLLQISFLAGTRVVGFSTAFRLAYGVQDSSYHARRQSPEALRRASIGQLVSSCAAMCPCCTEGLSHLVIYLCTGSVGNRSPIVRPLHPIRPFYCQC